MFRAALCGPDRSGTPESGGIRIRLGAPGLGPGAPRIDPEAPGLSPGCVNGPLEPISGGRPGAMDLQWVVCASESCFSFSLCAFACSFILLVVSFNFATALDLSSLSFEV